MMTRKPLLLLDVACAAVLVMSSPPATATAAVTGISGHYADGQVWITWTPDPVPPLTYAIYSGTTPFTSTTQATLIGRLYRQEWTPQALRNQGGGPAAPWIIPDGAGGLDTLGTEEGLFVETVQATGARYYAVVAWGDTAVTAGANRTAAPVPFSFSPADPPECHLLFSSASAPGYLSRYFYLWADGRDDHSAGRADFPVMANRHKNGMPSLFIVSAAQPIPPAPRPAVLWFHGGEGSAAQSRPGDRPSIHIDPEEGYLVAHNDDFQRYLGGQLEFEDSNSWWFGWTKGHDPFDSLWTAPGPGDTLVNYTQRRILWINDWLVEHAGVDRDRISIQGHSVGSAGATALGKAHPQRFATVSVFNNGFDGPVGPDLVGSPSDSLPTSLVDAAGRVVRAYDLFDLNTPVSPLRDLPVFRVWSGKNDSNPAMEWDAWVVEEYRRADSLGWGMELYWDERPHGLDSLLTHWSHGFTSADQTARDDARYQERYSRNRVFPAFYNHRLDPAAADPGDGTRGTGGIGVGDDWGTWGGWHDWLEPVTDLPAEWHATVFLIGGSDHPVDDCPFDSLTADLMIRKPQRFLPAPGTTLDWQVTSVASGDTLQAGTTTVRPDGLVSLPAIVVHRSPDSVRVTVTNPVLTGIPPRQEPSVQAETTVRLDVGPNPCRGAAELRLALPATAWVRLEVFDVSGRLVAAVASGHRPAGIHNFAWDGRDGEQAAPPGIYFARAATSWGTVTRTLVWAPGAD